MAGSWINLGQGAIMRGRKWIGGIRRCGDTWCKQLKNRFGLISRLHLRLTGAIFRLKLLSRLQRWILGVGLLLCLLLTLTVRPDGRMLRLLVSGNQALYENMELLLNQDPVKVHLIDCGQGDAILIEAAGSYIVIDGGPLDHAEKTAAYIKGITDSIDLLILTHPHDDHVGGALKIMEELSPPLLLTCHDTLGNQLLTSAVGKAEAMGIQVVPSVRGMILKLGEDITLECLHPEPIKYDNPNNYSGVYRLSYQGNDFLFLADLEKDMFAGLYARYDLAAQFVKAGHHGSATSLDDRLIRETGPLYLGISCGFRNGFNHPSPGVLDLLAEHAISYGRTDYDGTIVITGNGKSIRYKPER